MRAGMTTPRFADGEAYLAWEELQTERHEYVAGEIWAMTGARATHNTITLNAFYFLRMTLKGQPCRVYVIDLKLHINAVGDYLYPDVMVTGDPRDRQPGEDRFISHPWLVVEVLSDSTAAYDRGRKFELYRNIGTLTHYLLIEQDRPHAELFFKNAQGQWVLQPLAATDNLQIDALGQPWPIASLFEDVDFSRAAPSPPPPPPPSGTPPPA
jgi:Uma2 family endonuclease